jgi:hypothetical protein
MKINLMNSTSLDQPIMSIKELDISPGSVFQIAVTPTLMSTTPDAVARFTPSDRGCYVKGELPLKVMIDPPLACIYNVLFNYSHRVKVLTYFFIILS